MGGGWEGQGVFDHLWNNVTQGGFSMGGGSGMGCFALPKSECAPGRGT